MAVPNSGEESEPTEEEPMTEKNEKENEIKEEEKNDEEIKEKKPSRFESICYWLNINPNLVMLKLTLFTIYGGKFLTV